MLIVLAGLVGSGKSTIARAVAQRLGIPHLSIDEDKIEVGKRWPEFEQWIATNTPFPDDYRREVFARTLERLREVAKTHPHAIVDETFHKKSLREPFFREAAQIMNGLLITLVQVDDEKVKERLEKRSAEEDHIVGYGMYLSFKKVFEPFEHVDYILDNSSDDFDATLNTYLDFLKTQLNAEE